MYVVSMLNLPSNIHIIVIFIMSPKHPVKIFDHVQNKCSNGVNIFSIPMNYLFEIN